MNKARKRTVTAKVLLALSALCLLLVAWASTHLPVAPSSEVCNLPEFRSNGGDIRCPSSKDYRYVVGSAGIALTVGAIDIVYVMRRRD